jgi:large subunit ribosomal protein LP2
VEIFFVEIKTHTEEMKEIAAYVLLLLGGNATPSAEDISTLITSTGAEADSEKIQTLLTDLEGKDINELLEKGQKDLKACAGAIGAAAPAAKSGAAAAGGAAAPAAEEKPKVEEVDALDGGEYFVISLSCIFLIGFFCRYGYVRWWRRRRRRRLLNYLCCFFISLLNK